MTDLTDEDHAAIERVWNEQCGQSIPGLIEILYAAGLAAGRAQMRDEAARVCDTHTETVEYGMDSWDQALADTVANNCAAAIRALP